MVQKTISEKKAVIFDLFNTLTGSYSTWAKVPMTSDYLGIPRDKWIEHLMEKSRERTIGTIKDPVTIIERIVHAIDPSIPMDKIIESTKDRIILFESALINIPEEVIETIIELKKRGKKIGLCSNADAMEIAGWSKSPISSMFDSVVFSCEVGYMKPEPEIYQISLQQLGVKPEDTVFVGDGGSNELEGAQAVGLSTIMMTGVIRELWPEIIEDRKRWASHVIERIDELIR